MTMQVLSLASFVTHCLHVHMHTAYIVAGSYNSIMNSAVLDILPKAPVPGVKRLEENFCFH